MYHVQYTLNLHRASKSQGGSKRVLPWQVTINHLSHTHYTILRHKADDFYVRQGYSVLVIVRTLYYYCTTITHKMNTFCVRYIF